MSNQSSNPSVGLVQPQILHFDQPLALRSGQSLANYDLVYETYGTLNAAGSNAVLICHALSGDHHAAGYHQPTDKKPGWWDSYIGPGKAIDSERFYIVCLNNLGGCAGSTGPTSLNPATDQAYGPDFPLLDVADWVDSQTRLADALGIEQWAAVIGGSLGGMQALCWSIRYPERLRHAIVIASAPKLSAQNIAFNEIARQAISRDPDFHAGHYLAHHSYPKQGLALARMVGHVTYLSDEAMREKFGRELRNGKLSFDFSPEFQIQSYLQYKGDSFSEKFDANTYMLMTKALDYFDLAADFNGDLAATLSHAQCKFLVISFSTDWRFAPKRSEEIVNALITARRDVSYGKIDSSFGHDAFLIPNKRYIELFSQYMQGIDI